MKGSQAASAHGRHPSPPGHRHGAPSDSPDPWPECTALGPYLDRARRVLLALQKPDGHWVGELQGDTILESEYVLLMAFLGRERDACVQKAACYILRQQLPEGGWNNYPEGPAELSVSVKAYFALKLAGHDPHASYMRRARAIIRALGGAAHCNSFTKFYLALLGQIPYGNCPAVPPEMMLLPRWAYFNIHAMSSWTRTIVIPLSIFYAHKPVRALPPELGIAELFLKPPATPLWPHSPTQGWLSWTNFFLLVDLVYKRLDAWGLGPIRRAALKRAEKWLLDHFEDSDGVGAIFPPMIYTVVSLRCLGYADDSPEMQWALKQLEELMIEEDGALRLQPCFSPVWDTALTLIALADAGITSQHPAVQQGVSWLLEREVRRPGDWSVVNPHLEPAGWCFEYRNGFYPDVDDTAMVLTALAKTGHAGERNGENVVVSGAITTGETVQTPHPISLTLGAQAATRRALDWLLGMQNRNGGWAAFDRGVERELLTKVPFADHNAMLDPSCPDITGRVLEALGYYGYRVGQPPVDRALTFLEATQDGAGGWLGRWGVNYIYGTWQVLVGLKSVGVDMRQPLVQRAVAWLKQVQQPSGGWGETCRSYDDPTLAGQGTPTASQTAWAILGLLAAGEADSDELRTGIAYLRNTQQSDGTWHEDQFTGTGFPKVFYLKYHMYRLYFPLMALARYEQAVRNQRAEVRGQNGRGTGRNPRALSA